MSSRVGYIFHENFVAFSPFLCVRNHEFPFSYLKVFCTEYWDKHKDDTYDSGKFLCDTVMIYFIDYIKLIPQVTRIRNISNEDIERLKINHRIPNNLGNGLWLVDVSHNNFGNVSVDVSHNNYRDILSGSKMYQGEYNILNVTLENFRIGAIGPLL